MSFLLFFILTSIQLITGYGILSLAGIQLKHLLQLSLSLMLGIAISSIIPTALELLHIPLTRASTYSTIIICMLLCNIKVVRNYKNIKLTPIKLNIDLYEWPWITIIGLLFVFAAYRCMIMPPYPRDLLAGPEPIAEFALREHTFINSVFEIDFVLNNNPFKSLYIPSLQLIYKQIGFPFGKVWLIALNFSFLVFLYQYIKEHTHTIIAGLLVTILMFTPELYAYMYLVLYDYSNMVFFFVSIYCLEKYIFSKQTSFLYMSIIFISVATYIRPETIVLSSLIAVYITLYKIYKKNSYIKYSAPFLFVTIPIFIYFLTSYLYINYYLPIQYDTANELNTNLFNLTPFFQRASNMFSVLIFSELGLNNWGYIFWILSIVSIADIILYKKISENAKFWLSMLFVTYVGIALIGYLLPLADLLNTTKRALFKLLPIFIVYVSHTEIVKNTCKLLIEGFTNRKKALKA